MPQNNRPQQGQEQDQGQGQSQGQVGPKLFVGQVPTECSENELRGIFEPYGKIADVHILRGKDGKSRNCGFVTFENSRQARNAIEAVDRKVVIPPRKTPLVVSFAEMK